MAFFLFTDRTERDILGVLIASDCRRPADEIEWLILEEAKRRGIPYEPKVNEISSRRIYVDLRWSIQEVLARLARTDLRGNDDEIRWLIRAEGQRRELAAQKVDRVPVDNSVEHP